MEHYNYGFAHNPIFRSLTDSQMDSDFKHELLIQGCWLGVGEGFSLLKQEPSVTSNLYYDHLPYYTLTGSTQLHHEEAGKIFENPPPTVQELDGNFIETVTFAEESETYPNEGYEYGTSWWVDERSDDKETTQEHMSMGDSECFGLSLKCLKQEPDAEMTKSQWGNDEWNFDALYHIEQAAPVLGLDQQEPTGFENIVKKGGVSKRNSLRIKKGVEERQTKPEKTISLEVLRQHFTFSLKDAAKNMGVCPTTLKRICRQYGIMRWPARKIKKVNHSLQKLQLVVDSVEGVRGLIQIGPFCTNFSESSKKPDDEIFSPGTAGMKSNSSLFSMNSGSRNALDLAIEDPAIAIRRACSETESHFSKQEKPEGNVLKVKATFGEEHVRFSLQQYWGFTDLQQEIGKRFNINDFQSISLKYLDNDLESVLLTCDADLEECKDLFRFSSHTIKIIIQVGKQRLAR